MRAKLIEAGLERFAVNANKPKPDQFGLTMPDRLAFYTAGGLQCMSAGRYYAAGFRGPHDDPLQEIRRALREELRVVHAEVIDKGAIEQVDYVRFRLTGRTFVNRPWVYGGNHCDF